LTERQARPRAGPSHQVETGVALDQHPDRTALIKDSPNRTNPARKWLLDQRGSPGPVAGQRI
jgi:hypothetical protein